MDVDCSCVALDRRGQVLMEETVYFATHRSSDGSIVHSGDEQVRQRLWSLVKLKRSLQPGCRAPHTQTGDTDLGLGDDEIIVVKLASVPKRVMALVCIATVATEDFNFSHIKSCRFRLTDMNTGGDRGR